MKKTQFLTGVLLVLGLAGCVDRSLNGDKPKGEPAVVSLAVPATIAWLGLVDNGAYEASWTDAAPYFKAAVSQADWVKAMRAFRAPLGGLISRKIKSSYYTTALPGAPDGNYVVIQFDTVFERKAHTIETVTAMLDDDDRWNAAGYFIK